MSHASARLSILLRLSTLLLLSAATGGAMDISGVVLNKSDQPVPLAQVCFKNNPSRCQATSVNGTFRIVDGSPVLPREQSGYSLEFRGGRLAFSAPRGMRIRLAWMDPSGRTLVPERAVDIGAGRNWLELPDLPRNGLHILRVTAPEITFAWKVLLLDGSRAHETSASPGRGAGAAPAPAFLSKAAAIAELEVSKTGYRSELYLPSAEVENDAVIVLTALSDSGFVFTSTYKSANTLDRANGRFITEASYDTCAGATPVKTTFKDTLRFAVRDGRLYQWYDGQCVAEVATGTSTDVVGTWNVSQSEVYLPQDLRPAACKDIIPASSLPPTVKARYVIGETEQTLEVSSEVCPPDYQLPLIAVYLLTDTTIELSRNTCRQLAFKNRAGEEATITYSRRGPDSLASVFAYKGAACTGVENMREGDGVALDCSGNDPLFSFLECVAATAYFGDTPPPPAAKRSAGKRTAAVPGFRGPAGMRSGTAPLGKASRVSRPYLQGARPPHSLEPGIFR